MEGTNVICAVLTLKCTLMVWRQEEEMQGNLLLLYFFAVIETIPINQSVIQFPLKLNNY